MKLLTGHGASSSSTWESEASVLPSLVYTVRPCLEV